jgi:hypothetical protein
MKTIAAAGRIAAKIAVLTMRPATPFSFRPLTA